MRWWQRPAPRDDEELWAVVRTVQERRLALGVTVSELARRTEAVGQPVRRETLSRVLNGRQRTSWRTVALLSELLGVDPAMTEPPEPRGRPR